MRMMMPGGIVLLHRVDRESHRWIHRFRVYYIGYGPTFLPDFFSSYFFFSRVMITIRALARGRDGGVLMYTFLLLPGDLMNGLNV